MNIKLKKITIYGILLLLSVSCPSEEIAKCPDLPTIKTWEPFVWQPFWNRVTEDAIVKRITGTKKQGYIYTKANSFLDTKKDASVGNCTRDNFEALALSGVLVVNAHGMVGGICLAAVAVTDENVAKQWMDAGSGPDDMSIFNDWADLGVYMVTVNSTWFKKHWKFSLDSSGSIVILMACHGAENVDPFGLLKDIGGRTSFGWVKQQTNRIMGQNIAEVLDHMNGSKPEQSPGTKRKAGDAFAATTAGGKAPDMRMMGKSNTTLCPSVENDTKSNVSPIGPGAGLSGKGFIIFDTELNTEIAADKALTFNVTEGVTIKNISWTGKNRIDFEYSYDDECTPEYSVTVTAVAKSIMGNKFGMQQLDGGDIAGDGVAPNEHNFVWTFSK